MSAVEDDAYRFGSFQLIPARRLLLNDGEALRLGSRALDILAILVERAGETVSNDQIMTRAWPTATVEEGALRVHIGALRKALGDGRGGDRFIVNIPGRGYTFAAPVSRARSRPLPAPASTARSAASSLPRPLAKVIGRADAINAIAAQLARRQLLTITGAGGIGKTTVAIEVAASIAASYPDGVWFVALAPLPASGLVSSAIGVALGVDTSGTEVLSAVIARLRDAKALIVLDNCEHVVDAAATAAEEILTGAPRITILATSREPLRCMGEFVHRLQPLGIPSGGVGVTAEEAATHAAVQLFNERAQASDAEYSFSDADVQMVCEICRKLDGLPLALELAAVHVEVFGLKGLADGLADRFGLLTKGRRTAIQRQQTLRATLDWSHDLLPEAERIVLRRLAAFSGDFTMEAARAVAGDENVSGAEVIESIANLASKSLVTTDIGGDVTYHRLLETTRAYAFEKLAESVDAAWLKQRHAEYFRGFFETAEEAGASRGQGEWLAIYGRHIDNVRTALDWAFSSDGDARIAVALTVAAVPLWTHLSMMSECRDRVERALACFDGAAAEADGSRMRLSAALGWSLMYGVGRAREAGPAWATTLELAGRLEDVHYQLRALWGLCIDQFNNGSVLTALEFARRFADTVAGSADPIELMMGDRILATALHYLGDQNAARHHIDRALAYDAPAQGQPTEVTPGFDLLVSSHYFQARILWLQGFTEQALRVVERNVQEGIILGQALTFCSVLGQAACPIALFAGDLDAAGRYGAMLLEHAERHQIRLWHIWARCFNGLVMARRGDLASGIRILRDELERAGDARHLPRFLFLQAEQALHRARAGEVGPALENVTQMLARCVARDERWYVAELLRIKGELLLARDALAETADPEQQFLMSLDEARKQGALAWELRTATSLARLWHEQGRREEAGAFLRPVHARLTEGFASADPKAAWTLLQTLA